jgi:C-terminal processing protease CtpA/Prc
MSHKLVIGSIFTATLAFAPLNAQRLANVERDSARQMLRDVADAIRKHYYDPKFHGMDLEARVKGGEDQIRAAASFGDAFTAIASAIDPLNDSHTFFVPPQRSTRREYGYIQQMIGDRCFIKAVRPGSEASVKLSPGDEVVAWEGYTPARETLWKMKYVFNQLYALPVLHFVIRSSTGAERRVEFAAKLHPGKRVLDLTGNGDDIWQLLRELENDERAAPQRVVTFRESLMIWKLPDFDWRDEDVDPVIKQARKFPALVMDLRGNPGGLVKTLERITGGIMDHDVLIAKRIGRKSDLKPLLAKSRGKDAFSGRLIVLIDNDSASAAELLARVVQLEHRGTVLGDRSSGSVMEARHYSFTQGADTRISYGALITDADLVMADGKSLEHEGVFPDEVVLPTPADLSAGRDPVLTRAAKLAGMDLDPIQAGKLFPVVWRKY